MVARVACTTDDLPAGLIWITLPVDAGQAIEVQYANARGPDSVATDADYRRVVDHGVAPVSETYYRREDVPAMRWAMLDRTRKAIGILDSRTEAEGYSRAWHGHDRVLQVDADGRYLDATGRRLTDAVALCALTEAE